MPDANSVWSRFRVQDFGFQEIQGSWFLTLTLAQVQAKSEDKGKEAKQKHVGGCQNYGPFLGTLNNRCRIIIGAQKGTLILTTTHVSLQVPWFRVQRRLGRCRVP